MYWYFQRLSVTGLVYNDPQVHLLVRGLVSDVDDPGWEPDLPRQRRYWSGVGCLFDERMRQEGQGAEQ